MKRWTRVTVALCLGLVILMLVCILTAQTLTTARPLPIDTRYLPGKRVPNLPALCYWEVYSYSGVSCSTYAKPTVYYDRRYVDNTIQDVLFDTPGVQLGDLMQAWGRPVGAEYWPSGAHLYWPDGYSAWVFQPDMSPFSPVNWVEISPGSVADGPWRGLQHYAPTALLPGQR